MSFITRALAILTGAFKGGPDTHKFKVPHSHWLESGLDLDGRGHAETFKSSNLSDVTCLDFSFRAGDEDAIDVVRGSSITFKDGLIESHLDAPCRTFITIKGGVYGVVLENIVLRGDSIFPWQISFGDHTIYHDQGDRAFTSKIEISNVRRENGKRVVILCMLAERPMLSNGDYRIIKVPVFAVRVLFFTIKYSKKVLKIFNRRQK